MHCMHEQGVRKHTRTSALTASALHSALSVVLPHSSSSSQHMCSPCCHCALRLRASTQSLRNSVTVAKAVRAAAIALPPWVAVCCFFRYSKSHGYAAVVAAFTAVVIVLGTFNSRQQGADAPLARIQ
eukprot:19529-Heterococcus_DN1.PRE.1